MASGVKAAGAQEQASLRNVRTCIQHVPECRGGHACSSVEAPVMGVEQRGVGHRIEFLPNSPCEDEAMKQGKVFEIPTLVFTSCSKYVTKSRMTGDCHVRF